MCVVWEVVFGCVCTPCVLCVLCVWEGGGEHAVFECVGGVHAVFVCLCVGVCVVHTHVCGRGCACRVCMCCVDAVCVCGVGWVVHAVFVCVVWHAVFVCVCLWCVCVGGVVHGKE